MMMAAVSAQRTSAIENSASTEIGPGLEMPGVAVEQHSAEFRTRADIANGGRQAVDHGLLQALPTSGRLSVVVAIPRASISESRGPRQHSSAQSAPEARRSRPGGEAR